MSTVENKIVKVPTLAMGTRGVQLATFEDAFRFARCVIESGLAPKGMTKPEQVVIAIQSGAELGLSPMRSLSAVVVVNGKPSLYGEAALALIHQSGVCSMPPVLRHEGEGDEHRAVLRFQRSNMPSPVEVAFSVADAKKAHLWAKAGPWSEYSDTMLGWRAVARAGKLYFGDCLMGLVIAEEAADFPVAHSSTPPAEPDPLLAMPVVEAEVVEPLPDPPASHGRDYFGRPDAEPVPQPIVEPPVVNYEERITAVMTALRARNTQGGVALVWKAAKQLRDELDPASLDRLELAHEARLNELQEK
jgi:hypothetical protein